MPDSMAPDITTPIAPAATPDRIPERIRSLVYLDAFVPEDGENPFGQECTRGTDACSKTKECAQ